MGASSDLQQVLGFGAEKHDLVDAPCLVDPGRGGEAIERRRCTMFRLKLGWGTAEPLLRCPYPQRMRSNSMDKEHVKGAYDKTKGAVKDTIGKVTGDKKMQAEGKMDKAKGVAHNVAGDVKDAAKEATKRD